MKKKILCIDDSLTALLLLEYALNEAGYESYSARSVDEAVKLIETQIPDLILLDLSIPLISGYDFLGMREKLRIENVPVIVISAYDSQNSIDMIHKLGVDDFIPKPIKIDEVMIRIRKYLEVKPG